MQLSNQKILLVCGVLNTPMKNCVKMHVMEELDKSVCGKMEKSSINPMQLTMHTVHAQQTLIHVMMDYVIHWKRKKKASVHKIVFTKVFRIFYVLG